MNDKLKQAIESLKADLRFFNTRYVLFIIESESHPDPEEWKELHNEWIVKCSEIQEDLRAAYEIGKESDFLMPATCRLAEAIDCLTPAELKTLFPDTLVELEELKSVKPHNQNAQQDLFPLGKIANAELEKLALKLWGSKPLKHGDKANFARQITGETVSDCPLAKALLNNLRTYQSRGQITKL